MNLSLSRGTVAISQNCLIIIYIMFIKISTPPGVTIQSTILYNLCVLASQKSVQFGLNFKF